VGLKPITRLSHRVEDLLDGLFEGRLPWSPEARDVLFRSADALEDLVGGELEDTLDATERLESWNGKCALCFFP
jgi:chemotaxis protein histidine kinase CheA